MDSALRPGSRTLCAAIVACALIAACYAATLAAADLQYPQRPIRLIVATSPGGPNDLFARIVAGPWGEALGRQIVVDNRAGAAGMIGTEIVARAAPDGYTLLVGFPGPLIIGPLLSDNPPYHALKDFAPVSLSVSAPFVLVAHPGVPAKSLKDLVALAKAQPRKLNYASGGTGISSHMAMELFKFVAGFDMVHVPYKGAGPGLTAVLGAEVSTMFVAIPAAAPHLKSERLRALAVGGAQRSPLMPEVPTIKESGYTFDASSWYGVLAPRATPAAIVAKVHGTLTQTINAPSIRARLTEIAFDIEASTPQQFANHLRAELATWTKVIAAAGLRAK
jgi:tripartite-type tricarboxylate transporter receptor subunit TctC